MSRLKEILRDDAQKAKNGNPTAIGDIEPLEKTNLEETNNIEPCKTKEEFFEYAFDEFVNIEGKGKPGRPGEVYIDSEGHPTIGVGHLVVKKGYVLGEHKKDKKTGRTKYYPPEPDKVKAYRKKFIELPLLDNKGKPLSDEEKGSKYDLMISMMKTKKRGLTNREIASLNMGHLDEKGMHQVFEKDLEYSTNRAIKDHPEDFWNMSRSAQASLVHMYFWGKGKVAKTLESTEQETIGEQLPEAVRIGKVKPNDAIRNLADRAERDSVEYKNRQIEFTETNYASNRPRLNLHNKGNSR